MLESKVSEILENILGLLALEGSFEVEEKEDLVVVSIDTDDAGRLIGRQGETLSSLQLLVNQILARQLGEGNEFKKVVVDVANWRAGKEQDLTQKAQRLAEQVLETKEAIELEPMPAWQRRVIHMTIQDMEGVESESIGEGLDRHLVIKLADKKKSNKTE